MENPLRLLCGSLKTSFFWRLGISTLLLALLIFTTARAQTCTPPAVTLTASNNVNCEGQSVTIIVESSPVSSYTYAISAQLRSCPQLLHCEIS